jgi:hypothetical protein
MGPGIIVFIEAAVVVVLVVIAVKLDHLNRTIDRLFW